MEVDAEKLREDQQKPVTNSLAFCWDELVSNLMRSLQDLASYKGVPPEVCLRLGDEEMMMHGVLLAALSSWWRKRLDPLLQQDTLIIHNITVDIQPTHGVLYATRSLLYSGSMTVSSSLLEQVQSVTRSLNLDNHELSYSVCSNGMYSVQWTGFKEHLLRALQYMCCNQQCTDVAVVVNGHIIKAHKLILGASSPILNSAFQEDRRIRIIHLPDIKVKIAQSLITYMYFGKTCVQKDMLVDFHKLCEAFQVESLQELTKRFAAKVKGSSDKKPKSHVTIHARVRPEAKDLWGRLQQYYTVGRNADLMLVVENKRMLAHKTLFSAICPPIHELLLQELSNEHALVMITSMNHSLWEGILNIMYRGSCTIVGTAISTVFSYIDLSLFDIEVNEVKPAQKYQQEDKNNPSPTLINQRLILLEKSFGVPSFENNKKLNVKKRKSLSQSEKVMGEASSSKQIRNGRRIRRHNARLEDQDSIHNMIEDIKLLNDAATCSKEILMSTEPEPKTCKEKGNSLPSSATESSILEQNASWEGEKEKVSDEIFPKFRRDKSYSCMECGATFPSLLTLTVHSQSSHTTEATLETCEHCGKSYIQIKEIREHKNTDLGNQPLSCEQCAKFIIQGGLMHQHYKTSEEEKHVEVHERSLECLHCSETFPLRNLLEDHINTKHTGFAQHDFQSSKSFASPPSIKNHMTKEHRDALKHKCIECKITFKTESLLLAHMKCHRFKVKPYEEMPSICSKYDKQLATSDRIKMHELKCQESQSEQLDAVTTSPRSYDNMFSGGQAKNLMSSLTVTQLNELKDMEKIHRRRTKDKTPQKYLDNNKQNYFCPDCGDSFSDIPSLSAHAEALNHASVEESCWICGLCNAAFLREDELTRHMKVHENFMVDTQLPAHFQGEEMAISDIVQNKYPNRIVQVSTFPHNQDTIIGSHRPQSVENENVSGLHIYHY